MADDLVAEVLDLRDVAVLEVVRDVDLAVAEAGDHRVRSPYHLKTMLSRLAGFRCAGSS